MSDATVFVEVEVAAGEAAPDGLSLRFKAAGPPRPIARLRYEDDAGLEGHWRVAAVHDDAAGVLGVAHAVLVEDSSEGTVCLIVGGAHGLLLEHEASETRRREPYLLLAAQTEIS